MTDKINGHESHPDIEGAYEVQMHRSKIEPVDPEYQSGMRWPSVVALFIICATVVALCMITSAGGWWN